MEGLLNRGQREADNNYFRAIVKGDIERGERSEESCGYTSAANRCLSSICNNAKLLEKLVQFLAKLLKLSVTAVLQLLQIYWCELLLTDLVNQLVCHRFRITNPVRIGDLIV